MGGFGWIWSPSPGGWFERTSPDSTSEPLCEDAAASRTYRAAVSRWTPSSRPIRRKDQPRARNVRIVCTLAILSRFATASSFWRKSFVANPRLLKMARVPHPLVLERLGNGTRQDYLTRGYFVSDLVLVVDLESDLDLDLLSVFFVSPDLPALPPSVFLPAPASASADFL